MRRKWLIVFGPCEKREFAGRPQIIFARRAPALYYFRRVALMLRISLKPSRYLAVTLVAAHAAAAALVVPLEVPLAVKAALELAIVLSGYYSTWRTAMLRSGRCIVSLELDRAGLVNVRSRLGEWQEARLLGTTFVSPALTILNLKLTDRSVARHVIIMRDSLPAEDFRQLRVLLRWSSFTAGAGP